MDVCSDILKTGYRVAVLCGGSGSEREVSLVSGKSVAEAVRSHGLPCDLMQMPANKLPGELDPAKHLVLPIIHGTYGEDGVLSADLDRGGFAYAGCDQASSVICFDKLACKAVAAHLGLPMARDCYLPAGSEVSFSRLTEALGLPFVLKPRWDGSSVGLHLVRNEEQYAAAARDLARTDYLAEAYLDGCDLTVGVLGGEPMGVVAIHPEGGLYDYQHKYTSGMSRYDVPANLESELAGQLRNWSRGIFRACACRDLARVDFRMGSKGEVVFLEVNTLPGMTPTSLLPKSAQCIGLTFGDLVLRWVRFAFDRKEGKS